MTAPTIETPAVETAALVGPDRIELALLSLSQHLPTLPQRQRVQAALNVTGPARPEALRQALVQVRADLPTLPLKQTAASVLSHAA